MTYGLGNFGRMSDSEIATALGVPKARIASVRHKALKRLAERAAGSFMFR
ncbi:hypothetical protein [Streptomyces sp. Z26]|nr:hypothetical protein [Streptomyces sp. Z26]